jgi:hypothetical protein
MAWGTSRRFQLFAAAATIAACMRAYSQELPRWPDTHVARLQALALVETLNAEVLASRSATMTLETWCREHELANEPTIVAELVKGVVNLLRRSRGSAYKYRRKQASDFAEFGFSVESASSPKPITGMCPTA